MYRNFHSHRQKLLQLRWAEFLKGHDITFLYTR